jgi:hypothetical protein
VKRTVEMVAMTRRTAVRFATTPPPRRRRDDRVRSPETTAWSTICPMRSNRWFYGSSPEAHRAASRASA